MPRFRSFRSQPSASQTNEPPFTSFFERQKFREERDRSRRRIIVASIVVHVLVFGTLAVMSAFNVDELYSTNVTVGVASTAEDETGIIVSGDSKGRKPRIPRTNAEAVTGLHLRVTPAGVNAISVPVLPHSVGPAAARYLQSLQLNALSPVLRFPEKLGGNSLRATLTLRLAIGEDGKVVESTIKPPCPDDRLCEALLSDVTRLGPLNPHDGSLGKPWHVSVPVEFSSQR